MILDHNGRPGRCTLALEKIVLEEKVGVLFSLSLSSSSWVS